MARHTFFCIDAHTCGNPVRVVAGGGPLLPNVSMSEKREIFVRDHDWVRRALMFEPRGHDVMSGSILYPPSREDCDLGILYIEVSGCLPMCGHGTIGTVTAVIEEGLVVPRQEGSLAIEAPAGRIVIEYTKAGPYVEQVRLFNVASYLHAADVEIDVPGIGLLITYQSWPGQPGEGNCAHPGSGGRTEFPFYLDSLRNKHPGPGIPQRLDASWIGTNDFTWLPCQNR